jgi:hypothetical protein
VGTVSSFEAARQRRVASRFCFVCRTAWSLIAVRREGAYVVLCKQCGDVRATVPVQRRDIEAPRPLRP